MLTDEWNGWWDGCDAWSEIRIDVSRTIFFSQIAKRQRKKKKKRTEDVLAFRLTFFFWRFGLGLVVRTQATSDEQRTPKSLGQNVNVDVDRGNDKYRKQVQDGRRTCLFDFVCLWLWFLDSVLLASYSLVARNPCNEKELWISLAAVFPVRFWVGKVCSFVRRRCRIFFLQQKRHVHTHTFTHACDNFETSSTLACRSPFSFSLLLDPLSFLRDLWQPPQMINERTNDDRCRCY